MSTVRAGSCSLFFYLGGSSAVSAQLRESGSEVEGE